MKNVDWTLESISAIYHLPFMELLSQAHQMLRKHHKPNQIQICSLISLKTGGCTENCKYCAQSARYQTSVSPQPVMKREELIERAKNACSRGVSRVCLGAAWREVRDGKVFDFILDIVKEITSMGVEVCCTLGMLSETQAERLAQAGLYAYNHNLDTSRKYYPTIITTRTYDDRLRTIERVAQAGMQVCCGGIIGLGETEEDRIELLLELSQRKPAPESIPINLLVPIAGTPLENTSPVPIWEFLRMIATARIVFPKAMIRLSAGRLQRSLEEQALCFFAGANSIFYGEKLLTVDNPTCIDDDEMLSLFGLQKQPPFVNKDAS